MTKNAVEDKLENGTLIRHKMAGYQGRIDGITEIKSCFTSGGVTLVAGHSKEAFQYRVAVSGESLRKIAPAEDLEILEGVVQMNCPACAYSFQSKPDFVNKAGGRCECGGWICPACLACQGSNDGTDKTKATVCMRQRQRQSRKLLGRKRRAGN